MINNDILRRLRYALKLNDTQMLAIFKLMDHDIDKNYLTQILAKEEDKEFVLCRDSVMNVFLDGLIIHYRGKEEGREPEPIKKIISKNEILRKLRIALEFKAEDMLDVLKLVNFRLSKGELSAFFRKPGHRNYQECGDQVLRNFLMGLTKKNRPEDVKKTTEKAVKRSDKS